MCCRELGTLCDSILSSSVLQSTLSGPGPLLIYCQTSAWCPLCEMMGESDSLSVRPPTHVDLPGLVYKAGESLWIDGKFEIRQRLAKREGSGERSLKAQQSHLEDVEALFPRSQMVEILVHGTDHALAIRGVAWGTRPCIFHQPFLSCYCHSSLSLVFSNLGYHSESATDQLVLSL